MMFGIYNINDPILLMFNINDWCFVSKHSCKGYLRIYGGEVRTAENQWVIAARSRSRRPMPKFVKKYPLVI